MAIPEGVESGKIQFCDGVSTGRIIDTFDVDKNFIKEHANVSEVVFDNDVKFYAVAHNKTFIGGAQNTCLASYVYVK